MRAVWLLEGDAGRELAANADERRCLAAPQYHVGVGRAPGRGGAHPGLVDDEERGRRSGRERRQQARGGDDAPEGAAHEDESSAMTCISAG